MLRRLLKNLSAHTFWKYIQCSVNLGRSVGSDVVAQSVTEKASSIPILLRNEEKKA